jgi:hypothetical protein
MENKSKVEGHISLLRDNQTNAIINTSSTEYKNYITLKRQKENDSFTLQILQNEINFLKNELSELKNVVRSLISEIRSK